MQIISPAQIPVLRNSGIASEQLVYPETCPDARATITRVNIPPGATSPRHVHEASEQIWVVVSGKGTLLLDNGREAPLEQGQVVRTEPGEVHGFFNSGHEPFVYISVTTPPVNFRAAYEKTWTNAPPN